MSLTTEILFPNGTSHMISTGLFINNEFRASSDGKTFDVYSPATAEIVASVQIASKDDVDVAVACARLAIETTWGRKISPAYRAALLNKLGDLIERDTELLAQLESLNCGKAVRLTRAFDISGAVDSLRYHAGWCDKIHGKTINTEDTEFAYTRAEPVGVCGQIIPWNWPLMMFAWKIAPALAAGCTVVIKPSELTPLTALHVATLIVEAGFPPGVVNILTGTGPIAGDAISRHMDINRIAFTGSTAVGRTIMRASADSNLKRVSLELGGKSPVLVFPSADLEQAAAWTCLGIFFNTGQSCVAGSRVAVHEDVYDEFIGHLVEKAGKTQVGLPHEESTSFGPLTSEAQFKRVMGYIESGKEEGATLLVGGKSAQVNGKGWFVKPTIFADTKPGMKIHDEEVFGPVLCVRKFTDESEVIKWANDTIYGLGATVHSNDANQIHRVSSAFEAGSVWVNQTVQSHGYAPFGGYKQSGLGRECGEEGIYSYLEIKTVHQKIGGAKKTWPL